MSKNREILDKEAEHFPASNRVKYFDMVLESGKGVYLYDVDGKEYIDFIASASSANAGHSHPKIVKAIQEQAEKLIHFTPAYYGNRTTSSLLEDLAELAPGNARKKVALGNSGSDANDALIKYARAYTGRPTIISFTGGYHGTTYGSISLSGISLNMSRKIGPLLPNIVKMPFPDSHKKFLGETDQAFSERMFEQFLEPFEHWLPAEEVAVVLIEAIQGDGGIMPVPKHYMKLLYKFCQQNGILFAVDEINQGFGRTGKFWAIDHYDIEPDLMTVGKSLAAGLPLSALIGRAEIMDGLGSPAHAFTTAGNPICTAAAQANLEVIKEEKLVQRSERLGKLAKAFFEKEAQKHSFIGEVRMIGLNGGIDIVNTAGEPDATATQKIIYRLFEKGILVTTLRSNIIRIQPPLVITEDELKIAFDRISQVFDEAEKGELKLPQTVGEIGW